MTAVIYRREVVMSDSGSKFNTISMTLFCAGHCSDFVANGGS